MVEMEIRTVNMPLDISRTLFGKRMKNPLILASGVLGVTRAGLERVAESGAGALTTKSLSLEPRKGHEGPIIIETECGLLNAVGYSNPGIGDGIAEFSGWKRDEPLIISIAGKDEKEFAHLAARLEQSKKTLNCAAVEIALSCPHTPGFGLMAGQADPKTAGKITAAVRDETKLPVIAKLSPSVPGEVEAARLAEKAGASAINMGNSLGPGMRIDINRGKPLLGFRMGGLSGPAIKPITVRCVYDIYDAVDIPVIGTGGVNSGQDAIEMLMAGASLVGVGSAVYFRGPDAFMKIEGEMRSWMKERGYKRVDELVGVAHD
jgi:dihydroorotate dehydrogenase (NAD+) catalytic subunit